MTIGCIEDAAVALNRNGTLIGSGGSRDAYLVNGVVYKIENGCSAGSPNAMEFENYLAHYLTLPKGIFFPVTNLFQVSGKNIIAMEYIEGQPVAQCFCIKGREEHYDDCMSPYIAELVSEVIEDISGMNVIVSMDGIYIIDIEY